MDFKRLFEPKRMAVIGVSQDNDRNPANVIYHKNNLRYPVEVLAVNPRGGVLQGREMYPDISSIPHKIDLAVIAVRADHCPTILSECIQAGVGGAAIISGGFAESGKKDIQDRMVEMAKKAEFPFIGPNCLGIYSPSFVDTFFLPSERMVRPEAGNVAIVSQSGGILVDQIIKFAEEGVGLSQAISIGNKALVGELDLLEYFTNDPKTDVIAFYIEGFGKDEGRKFVNAADSCGKPIIVLKAGKSPGGSKAVSSHTASLAGDYETFSAIISQFGIVEARNEYEMVSFCESLSCYPQSIEGKIGIITGSGGHGALAVDVCTDYDISVPSLSGDKQNELKKNLSKSIQEIATLNNPVDLTGSSLDDDFIVATQSMCLNSEIDCIILLLLPYTPGITSDLGARLSQLYREHHKPLIAYVPHVDKFRMLIEGFELNNVPVSPSIEGAVQMAEAMKRCQPC